jgi:hypothetical protein
LRFLKVQGCCEAWRCHVAAERLQESVFEKDSRHSLDQFFSVALHPLRLAFRFSMVHKFILDALFPISAPRAEFLQDCAIIREYRLNTI